MIYPNSNKYEHENVMPFLLYGQTLPDLHNLMLELDLSNNITRACFRLFEHVKNVGVLQ